MSNNSNLSALAAALDDGTSGQVLQSTGSGGVAFADASSGVTIHNTQAAMLTDAASADEGTLHYETDNNKLYVKASSGFYLLASITNVTPTIDSYSENTGGAGANNLSSGGTFTLTAGSNTVITINASDANLDTLTYSATVTSGTATNVISSPSFPVSNQSSNVFTLTPASAGGTVTIRFDVSDGTNVSNVSHSFTLALAAWASATQEAKLNPSDPEASAYFGASCSISQDGNYAIIGAYAKDEGGVANVGAAYIFTRSGSTWSQQAKLLASDREASDFFGEWVDIDSDGDTAIVGANNEDTGGSNAGAAYIFTRSGTTWSQQAKIQGSDTASPDRFGRGISISDDGNKVVVGAPLESDGGTYAGAAYVFTRSGSTWSQQQKLTASDASANDQLGHKVGISGDGNTIILGAPDSASTDAGAAYIFTLSGSTWSQQAKLSGSDTDGGDLFGYSVSISQNGNTAIVGAYSEDGTATDVGAAYIFTRSGSTWSQQAKLTASDAETTDRFAWSVDMSDDGDRVIISAHQEDTTATDAGSAYIFTRSGTTWTQRAKLQASDAEENDRFSYQAVAISGDGDTAIVGAYQEDPPDGTYTSGGSAYVFTS